MALEDEQLVPQEGVFGNELGHAANRIVGSSFKQGDGVGFEHLLDALTCVADDIEDASSEAIRNDEHATQIAP